MSRVPGPPRWAVRLVRRVVPWAHREELLGDLHERWETRRAREGALARLRADAWYARQAVVLAWTARGGGAGTTTGGGTMGKLGRDLRYALRTLRRSPLLTLVGLVSLGLGIGANTALFTVVNAVLLRPLPVEDPATLYNIYTLDGSNPGNDHIMVSVPNFEDLAAEVTTFEDVVAIANAGYQIDLGDGEPQSAGGEIVSANYFTTLGVRALHGRLIQPSDDQGPGTGAVAVLSHATWQRLFGGDPAAVGRTVRLNDTPFEIIGVTPPGFKGTATLSNPDRIWVPWSQVYEIINPAARFFFEARRALPINVFGRLADGVDPATARAELSRIASRLEEAYPEDNNNRTFAMVPMAEAAVGVNQRETLTTSSTVLMGTVGLILLIACANLANLLLARASGRSRELALRASLGAGRWDLVRQMLMESLLLAGAGGVVGLLLARWGSRLLLGLAANVIPTSWVDVGLDGSVLAFTGVVSMGTGLLFGLLPALTASRPDISGILKEGGRQQGGLARSPLRSALVVAEVAFAVVGLVGAGLFIRSMQAAAGEDFGYEVEGLAVVGIGLGGGYGTEETVQYFRQARELALALPGVETAGFSGSTPLNDTPVRTLVPHSAEELDEGSSFVGVISTMPGYFETMGIPPVQGRGLEDRDVAVDAPYVAVVNQALVDRYWPNQDPIGQTFNFFADEPVREVVGVVPNVTFGEIGGPPRPAAYLPTPQWPIGFGVLHLRVRGEAPSVLARVRERVLTLDPDVNVAQLTTAEDLLRETLWARRMGAGMVGVFGAVALILAVVGIHAVMSFTSTQRRHEIGVRMALGAAPDDVLWMVVRQGMTLVWLGVLVGVGVSLALGQAVSGLLYGIRPADPVTLAAVPLVLSAVAFVACFLPALRSTRTSPVRALGE